MQPPAGHARLRFDGWIAGVGTASGTRVVVGHWARSPFGPFSDVMLERPDGHRLLLAPTQATADFIAATYTFDRVRVTPVRVVRTAESWTVAAGSLDLRLTLGRRSLLGFLLSAVIGPVAARPAWTAVTDPLARLLLNVRTHGSGGGRSEWYGVRDLRPITAAAATFEGRYLGPLAPVEPPVRFGFGSTPRTPSVVRVTTTVEVGRGGAAPRTPPSAHSADRAVGEAPRADTRSRQRRRRPRLLPRGRRRWH
ncbi:hypothetical protein [Streptomyces lydicus]|uniref:hypothetical protein n=1 Tax=Streptomyces lydicus TaxID=47763 RepID=UPI0037D238E6